MCHFRLRTPLAIIKYLESVQIASIVVMNLSQDRHRTRSSAVVRSSLGAAPVPELERRCRGPSAATTAFSRCAMLSMMPLPRVVTNTSARTYMVCSWFGPNPREIGDKAYELEK